MTPTHWTDWAGKTWRISLMPNALLTHMVKAGARGISGRIPATPDEYTAMAVELLKRPQIYPVVRNWALQIAPPKCECCDRISTRLVGQHGWCSHHINEARAARAGYAERFEDINGQFDRAAAEKDRYYLEGRGRSYARHQKLSRRR